MRVIYVVSSAGRDFYSALTRVSVASLRLTNPRVRIDLVCDAVSESAMRAVSDPLLDELDSVIVSDAPQGEATFRNRFVKTRLRLTIDGPFLFLDSDLLMRAPLDEIFETKADVAGAPNSSKDAIAEQIWSGDQDALDAMGWSGRPDVYVNGGVLFFQDSEPARQFSEEWHKRWLLSYERGHSYRDQPALNSALAAVRPRLHVLPHRFNAQFRTEPRVAAEAAVWHYYASTEAEPTTLFELMVLDLLRRDTLDKGRVEEMIRSSHPWRRDPLYRFVQAKGLARKVYRRLKSLGARKSGT
jgi:hypothetical protein